MTAKNNKPPPKQPLLPENKHQLKLNQVKNQPPLVNKHQPLKPPKLNKVPLLVKLPPVLNKLKPNNQLKPNHNNKQQLKLKQQLPNNNKNQLNKLKPNHNKKK